MYIYIYMYTHTETQSPELQYCYAVEGGRGPNPWEKEPTRTTPNCVVVGLQGFGGVRKGGVQDLSGRTLVLGFRV